jgi:hypothetical protein
MIPFRKLSRKINVKGTELEVIEWLQILPL